MVEKAMFQMGNMCLLRSPGKSMQEVSPPLPSGWHLPKSSMSMQYGHGLHNLWRAILGWMNIHLPAIYDVHQGFPGF